MTRSLPFSDTQDIVDASRGLIAWLEDPDPDFAIVTAEAD